MASIALLISWSMVIQRRLYGVRVLWLLATTLLLTLLQALGEEYGLRGLVFRVAGSRGRGPRTALVLGVLVSSVTLAVIHLSTDPG